MGAESFIHEIEAKTARAAFDILTQQANESYGTEPYNGTINTCSMGSRTLKFDNFSAKNLDEAYKHINKLENGEKWQADYVDVGVSNYVVTTIKKVNVTGEKPIYKMQYCIYGHSNLGDFFTGYHYDTKTEADKIAIEFALKDSNEYRIKKEYTNTNKKANGIVSEIIIQNKSYKTKPKLKPLPNRKCEEVHTFIFYGWASC